MQYGLLGEKLSHSYSPELHAMFGDYPYELYEISPEALGDFLRARDFQGLNVTIPYKTTVMAVCDHLTEAAEAIGSVNTVVREPGGGLLGDNTDAAGFEGMLWKSEIPVRGKKCLVLGSGGASLAVQYVLDKQGAGEVVVISRSGKDSYDNIHRHKDAQVIINATPVGMYPNTAASPVDLREFPACEGVLDLIYNPSRTALIQQAEALRIPRMGGLYMLVEQARFSAQIFTKKTFSVIRTVDAFQTLRRRKENRVLIGMPGCGKTTVGYALAQFLDRPFVDCDQKLEESFGVSCEDFINRNGEDAFRDHETALLAKLGKESGLVISTGGGCVTRAENYPHLHQNGAIIFLERELSKLPRKGRPLSLRGNLQDMYTIRLPMYRRFADLIVANNAEPERVARNVEVLYDRFNS
ncbi:MAG: shikimate kinase [Ruminiclostridium sp.]|jgi:shikimate dehydrogenase|nr:shikimate kinase [Ruminiclostridium sp.]